MRKVCEKLEDAHLFGRDVVQADEVIRAAFEALHLF
jgi:hypothetical protein